MLVVSITTLTNHMFIHRPVEGWEITKYEGEPILVVMVDEREKHYYPLRNVIKMDFIKEIQAKDS